MYEVKICKGFRSLDGTAYELNRAERIVGLWPRVIAFLAISLLLSAYSTYIGVGQESLSKYIYDVSSGQFAAMKGLFGIGQVIQGVIKTALFMFFSAIIFWIFTDLEFRKLLVVQLFPTAVYLAEKIVLLPLRFYFGIDTVSSPFSFGVIAQYIFNNEWLHHFFAMISIFAIWIIYIQYRYLIKISDKSKKVIFSIVIFTNLFIWLFASLFSYIKFEVLL